MVNSVSSNLISGDLRKNAEKFADLSNQELLYIAHNQTVSEQKTKRNNLFNNAVIKAVPVVDSAIFASQKKQMLGLTAGSTLAPTLGAFATRLAFWGFFLGVFDLTSRVFNKITNKSDKLSEIKEKHPLLHTVADLALGYGAYVGARKGGLKVIQAVPASTKAKIKKKLTGARTLINNSNLAKKVFEPLVAKVVDFTKKYPKLAEKLPQLKKYAIPAVLTGMIIKTAIVDPLVLNKKITNNFVSLKQDQEAIKDLLAYDSAQN